MATINRGFRGGTAPGILGFRYEEVSGKVYLPATIFTAKDPMCPIRRKLRGLRSRNFGDAACIPFTLPTVSCVTRK